MSNSSIDVSIIVPEAKDDSRAAKLCLHRGEWQATPVVSDASKMARAIDDPYKLVRRTKAVAKRYGVDSTVLREFKYRLIDLGFTADQIKLITLTC